MSRYITLLIFLFIPILSFSQLDKNTALEQAMSLHDKALNMHEIGKSSDAITFLKDALTLLESIDMHNTSMYAVYKHDIGMLYLLGSNDFENFEVNMQTAINLKEQLSEESNYNYSKSCYADGLTRYAKLIGFPKNLTIYEKAIKVYESIPLHEKSSNYIEALRDMAFFYQNVSVEKSINLTLKSLQLHRRTNGISVDSLVTLSNLADYYCDYGNYNKALYFNNIVLNARNNKIPLDYNGIRLSNLRSAKIYSRLGNYEKAIFHSKISSDLAFEIYGEISEQYTRSLQNMGMYYLANNNIKKALKYMKKAYDNPMGNKLDLSHNLAIIYSYLNNLDSCYLYTQETWEISKKIYLENLQQLSEENRFHYVCSNRVSIGMTLPIDLLLSHENSKELSRLSYDGILFGKNVIMDCMLNNEVDSITKNINWSSIQSYLHKGEVAIEFWTNKNEAFDAGVLIALVLRKEWDSPRLVKLSKDKIYRTINGLEQTTESYLPLFENIWKEIIEVSQLKDGEKVYISLDDILSQIPIESICNYDFDYVGDKYDIIRVSSTRNIPKVREQMITSEAVLYGGLKYDSSPIATQKESSIHYSTNRSIQENLFDLMTDSITKEFRSSNKYLPWTKVEVDSIYTLLSNSKKVKEVRLYKEEKGVEESFKMLSGNSPSIIHIATHGVSIKSIESNNMSWFDYYSYCMEHSGLLFSGALNTDEINADSLMVEDGILRSNEISLLDLNKTDLVVLSACKTGTGGVTPFGLAGLQWALKAAGVKTLILSLNDVDDAATYTMMISFYQHLMKGYSKREAFKKAQKALRDSVEFKSFNYWANFVMLD